MEESRKPRRSEFGLPPAGTGQHRKHAHEFKTTVASKLESLAKIHSFIEDVGRRLYLPGEFVFDIQTAVGEACTNIIQHAYGMRSDRPIVVGCRLRDRDFIVRIRDFGQPFSPDTMVLPKVNVKLSERRPGGLGMRLMKKLVNRVKYTFDGQRGNELTLVKKLPESAPPDIGQA